MSTHLLKTRTAGYKPAVGGAASNLWGLSARRGFTLNQVEVMREDGQVDLCLKYKGTPLYTATVGVKATEQAVAQFVRKQFDRLWKKSLGVVLEAFPYGRSASEVLYRKRGGLYQFDTLKYLAPKDTNIYTLDGRRYAVELTANRGGDRYGHDVTGDPGSVELPCKAAWGRPAKGFWYVHQPIYDQWYGRSCLIGAWYPWRLKTLPGGGAMDAIGKWYYRHAYRGYTIRHPDQVHQDDPNAAPIDAQSLARQLAESIKTGADITLSSAKDAEGKDYLWKVETHGEINGSGADMTGYVKDFLDVLIQRGIGIPDGIITDGPGQGYAGRKIPEDAYYTACELDLNAIVELFDDEVVRPLVRLNFGRGARYEVNPGTLVPARQMAGQQPGQEGGQRPGNEPPPNPIGALGGDGHQDSGPGGTHRMSRQARRKVFRLSGTPGQPDSWQEFTGPRGGHGFRRGDDKRYQDDKPLSRKEAAKAKAKARKEREKAKQRERALKRLPRDVQAYLRPEEVEQVKTQNLKKLTAMWRRLPADEEYEAAATAGRAKRGWYADAARLMRDIFPDDADWKQFVGVLAATSPRMNVDKNMLVSVRLYRMWVEAGRPTEQKALDDIFEKVKSGFMPKSHGPNVKRVLLSGGEAPLSGYKVENFRHNNLGDLDLSTNDVWMANFAEWEHKFVGTAHGYYAMTAKIRKVAEKMGWTAAEVQETVWSFFRTLTSLIKEDETGEGALRKITHEEVGNTADFATLLLENKRVQAEVAKIPGLRERVAEARRRLEGRKAGRESGQIAGGEGKGVDPVLERIAARAERLKRKADKQAKKQAKKQMSFRRLSGDWSAQKTKRSRNAAWKNSATGEVRYQRNKPGSRRPARDEQGNKVKPDPEGDRAGVKAALREVIKGGWKVFQAAGRKAKQIEHVAHEFAAHGIDERIDRLQPRAKALAAASWKVTKLGTKVAFATYLAGQRVAEAVAKERGATEEEAAKLKGLCTALDLAGAKAVPLTLGAIGLGGLGLAASFLPAASLAYLCYSTAKNPVKTAVAALKVVREVRTARKAKSAGLSRKLPEGASEGLGHFLKRLRQHEGDGGWYEACAYAALDGADTLEHALSVADRAVDAYPDRPPAGKERLSAEVAWQSYRGTRGKRKGQQGWKNPATGRVVWGDRPKGRPSGGGAPPPRKAGGKTKGGELIRLDEDDDAADERYKKLLDRYGGGATGDAGTETPKREAKKSVGDKIASNKELQAVVQEVLKIGKEHAEELKAFADEEYQAGTVAYQASKRFKELNRQPDWVKAKPGKAEELAQAAEELAQAQAKLGSVMARGADLKRWAAREVRDMLKARLEGKKTVKFDFSAPNKRQRKQATESEGVTDAGVATFEKGMEFLNGLVARGDVTMPDLNLYAAKGRDGKPDLRAHYMPKRHAVNWQGKTSVGVAVHEAVHGLEAYSPEIQKAVKDFYAYRTAGEEAVRLSDVLPGSGYGPNEKARRDRFDLGTGSESKNWYCGKDYGKNDAHSEILTMGVEQVYRDPVGFARADPEYFAFVVGVLDGSLRG